MIAHNDDMALGAVRAMRVMGAPLLPVVGIDGLPEAIAAVREGELLLTLQQDARREAFETLDMIIDHLRHDSAAPTERRIAWKAIGPIEIVLASLVETY